MNEEAHNLPCQLFVSSAESIQFLSSYNAPSSEPCLCYILQPVWQTFQSMLRLGKCPAIQIRKFIIHFFKFILSPEEVAFINIILTFLSEIFWLTFFGRREAFIFVVGKKLWNKMFVVRASKHLSGVMPSIAAMRLPVVRSQAVLLLKSDIACLPQVECTRTYAKAKKIKEKVKNRGGKVAHFHLNEERLKEIVNLDSLKTKMEKAIQKLEEDFVKNLSLRSTTGSIEAVKVKFEGEEHDLQDIAQIIRKNPKTIVVNMVAFPQAIPATLRALEKSGMNLNPQQDGTTVYIPVPKVTKEHRLNLAKNAKALFIKCRDHIKDAQNDAIRKVKNNKEISEDENHSARAQLTEIGDEFVARAQKMFETKEKELLGN